MNFQDPSLYGVTPREINNPFVPPFAWQNFSRFQPFQAYGMQPFQAYGMQPFQTYGMQPFQTYGVQPFHPYFMQQNFPFAPIGAPIGQFGALPYPSYGTYGAQPFVPPSYGYGTPFQGMPCGLQGSSMGLPYGPTLPGWQKPLWY